MRRETKAFHLPSSSRGRSSHFGNFVGKMGSHRQLHHNKRESRPQNLNPLFRMIQPQLRSSPYCHKSDELTDATLQPCLVSPSPALLGNTSREVQASLGRTKASERDQETHEPVVPPSSAAPVTALSCTHPLHTTPPPRARISLSAYQDEFDHLSSESVSQLFIPTLFQDSFPNLRNLDERTMEAVDFARFVVASYVFASKNDVELVMYFFAQLLPSFKLKPDTVVNYQVGWLVTPSPTTKICCVSFHVLYAMRGFFGSRKEW